MISSLNFRESGLDEFVEAITFHIINRLRHYREEQVIDDTPQWLKSTVEAMHDKTQFGDHALENMVRLSAKSRGVSDPRSTALLQQNADADYQ